MPTVVENLKTRRAAIATKLAALTPYSGDDLPNTTGPGEQVDFVGYRKSLLEELAMIDKAIAVVEGPYENYSCVQV